MRVDREVSLSSPVGMILLVPTGSMEVRNAPVPQVGSCLVLFVSLLFIPADVAEGHTKPKLIQVEAKSSRGKVLIQGDLMSAESQVFPSDNGFLC